MTGLAIGLRLAWLLGLLAAVIPMWERKRKGERKKIGENEEKNGEEERGRRRRKKFSGFLDFET